MEQKRRCKIVFDLIKDDDYPPADTESLWAIILDNGKYEIDNIPFFIKDISCSDIVSASYIDQNLKFDKLISSGGHSTIRVIMFDEDSTDRVRDDLKNLGCDTEGSHISGLFSVDVPAQVDLSKVVKYLQLGSEGGLFDYEEAAMRHQGYGNPALN
jgi:hypothetical protein